MLKRLNCFVFTFLLFVQLFSIVTDVSAQPTDSPRNCLLPDAPVPAYPNLLDQDAALFAVVGDTGTGCDTREPNSCTLSRVMTSLQKETNFNSLIFLGDNIYTFGNPRQFKQKVYLPYKDLAERGVLLRGVLGNHDASNSRGEKLQTGFFRLATNREQRAFVELPFEEMMKKALADFRQTYYRFTLKEGLVDMFVLDSSMLADDYVKSPLQRLAFWIKKYKNQKALAEQQKRWLREELKNSTAKWKIILMHHPLYSSASEHGVTEVKPNGDEIEEKIPREMRAMRELKPIFKEFNIKLALAGHDHGFEKDMQQEGVFYFVNGGGSKLRSNDWNPRRRTPPLLPNFYICGNSSSLSFMLFFVTETKIKYWAINDKANVFDFGTIN